ncbi:SUMF1/EgtB/PvdO family nonheme iron enzyme [Sorangium sp. So ce1024]|uniref:SUMF1/EgtB/PvdO family nonheme iron enzyme n=1 Tax=Sorangium sp. So ce1024 TaxID=3133327 RepID=UPI003F527F63
MAGDMSEWTLDRYADYKADCSSCAIATGDSSRVIRGGSWRLGGVSYLFSSFRIGSGPSDRYSNRGARCARTP